jgi:alpha-amylase
MTQLDHAGLVGISPLQAVTFVENPDTDTDGYSSVIWNKMLAYAYILTSEGYPCVYYKDYSTDTGCYGLKPLIDNLIWIHENLAFGQTIQRWKDYQCFTYERLGYPNLLVGLNNDMSNGWRTITVQTGFGPNVQLHDYSGHAGDVWTNGSGAVTIGIPENDNGMGYVCYSRLGYGQPFSAQSQMATQVFAGADDLDIGPARDGRTIDIGRCWCAAGTSIAATLEPATEHWIPSTQLILELVGPDGVLVASQTWVGPGHHPTALHAQAKHTGFYTVRLAGKNLPAKQNAYQLTVQYTAPQHL